MILLYFFAFFTLLFFVGAITSVALIFSNHSKSP